MESHIVIIRKVSGKQETGARRVRCVIFVFNLRERKRERASRGEGQREGEKIFSRLHGQCEAQCGTRSHNPGIVTELKSRVGCSADCHPGTPRCVI